MKNLKGILVYWLQDTNLSWPRTLYSDSVFAIVVVQIHSVHASEALTFRFISEFYVHFWKKKILLYVQMLTSCGISSSLAVVKWVSEMLFG